MCKRVDFCPSVRAFVIFKHEAHGFLIWVRRWMHFGLFPSGHFLFSWIHYERISLIAHARQITDFIISHWLFYMTLLSFCIDKLPIGFIDTSDPCVMWFLILVLADLEGLLSVWICSSVDNMALISMIDTSWCTAEWFVTSACITNFFHQTEIQKPWSVN